MLPTCELRGPEPPALNVTTSRIFCMSQICHKSPGTFDSLLSLPGTHFPRQTLQIMEAISGGHLRARGEESCATT